MEVVSDLNTLAEIPASRSFLECHSPNRHVLLRGVRFCLLPTFDFIVKWGVDGE